MVVLLRQDRELVSGHIVDRPNRFVVRVTFEEGIERVYLGDPGQLDGVIESGREICCSRVDGPDRSTAFDAIAVRLEDVYVSVRPALANDLFEEMVCIDAVPGFIGYTVLKREPQLRGHGRADFLVEAPDGAIAFIEVKSCTHVDDRVAKFPDRQSERGRRHLDSLARLHHDGIEAHVVFVIQRPDVDRFQPFRAVDPGFADRLATVSTLGVGVHAVATSFEPPNYHLSAPSVPIELR